MSVPATHGALGPSDALAAGQRVQQLQTLLARAQEGSLESFASALEAAGGNAESPASPASPAPSAPAGTPYDGLVERAAGRYGIDPSVLHGLIEQESGFDPSSRSSAGAVGLTQLMPQTAASLGVQNPLDPTQSIEGGARYLSEMLRRFGGNVEDALAAYNAGPGAVARYGGVPPYAETQDYVAKVLGYAAAYRQGRPAAATPTMTAGGALTSGAPATGGALA